MTTIHLRDIPMHTFGNLPKIGQAAPNFIATTSELASVSLSDFAGKRVLLNVYPSIDTSVCLGSVKRFNKEAKTGEALIILCISMDLPFALKRIATGEELTDILLLSDFRNREFGELYGLTITDGPLAGLLARAVIALDETHTVTYVELVSDISNPPDYLKALQCSFE